MELTCKKLYLDTLDGNGLKALKEKYLNLDKFERIILLIFAEPSRQWHNAAYEHLTLFVCSLY